MFLCNPLLAVYCFCYAGLFHEPTASGQFAAGLPRQHLCNVELRTQPSQDSIAPRTPVTPAAPPTRLDSKSSIPYITTPTPPPEDGWGGCGSAEKWPDRGTACPSPPVPKALFLKPAPHQQSPPEETVRDNTHPKENQSPTPADAKGPQQNEVPGSAEDSKQSLPKEEKHDSAKTPETALQQSVKESCANAPAAGKQAKQPPQHPETSQAKEDQELAALKKQPLNAPPTPRPKNAPPTPSPQTGSYKGGFYWKTLFRYYMMHFFCACEPLYVVRQCA